jgi:hypothetical protein
MLVENSNQSDFIVTENQLHAVEVIKFTLCQGKLVTGKGAEQLVTVWGDKASEGYKASEIAGYFKISQSDLKRHIQYIEIKDYLKLKIKSLIFTTCIVRHYRAVVELIYILQLKMKKESYSYSKIEDIQYYPSLLMAIAPTCSGKSTFSKKKKFCGYALYDSLKKPNDLNKSWDRATGNYEDFRKSFLRDHPGKACVLDPFYNIRTSDGIYMIVVMPPKEIHLRNYKVRRKITGTFSMKTILKWRKSILQFAIENGLQIFPDFETALTQLSKYDEAKTGQS